MQNTDSLEDVLDYSSNIKSQIKNYHMITLKQRFFYYCGLETHFRLDISHIRKHMVLNLTKHFF